MGVREMKGEAKRIPTKCTYDLHEKEYIVRVRV